MTKPDTSRERGCFECGEEVYCYSCGAHLGYSALLDRAEKAEAELRILKEAGICEVASRNPSVMEYMKHWEARAEKAEADRDTAYARGREQGIREALAAYAQHEAVDLMKWADCRSWRHSVYRTIQDLLINTPKGQADASTLQEKGLV